MVHAPVTKFHVISSVLDSGFDGNLAKGQFAVVKNTGAKKGLGKAVVSDFKGLVGDDLISLEIGVTTTPSNLRIKEVPYKSTGMFPLKSITAIKAYIPSHVTLKVDHLEIGYDGVNASSALFIPEGKSAVMDIVVEGEVASMFFGRSEYIIQKRAYREKGQTMQEVIRKLVKELNEDSIPTSTGWASSTDKLSQFLEIGVIDSDTVATVGVSSQFTTLTLADKGDSLDLADIQAQYPAFKVLRTERKDEKSVYTIVKPLATVIPNYVKTTIDVDGKDCKDCLPGYTLVEGGYVYHVAIEDDGTDSTATVAGLFTGELSVIKFGNKGGKGVYSVVSPTVLTQAQYDAVITARPEAEVTLKGEVKDVCSSTISVSTAWVAGKTCTATTKTFTILLKDNECGQSRLVELQSAYPELIIVETAVVGGCKRTYSTTVATNLVCAECSPIYLQPFYAEAPESYGQFFWDEVVGAFDADTKMGIIIKGKPFYLYPEAIEEDFIPFVETSLKVRSASFGWREDDILNYTGSQYDVALEFAKVVKLEYAQDVNNLSQSLFGAEDEGNLFGTNKSVHKANLFARANLSQERILKYHKRILKYVVYTHDTSMSQGGGGRSDISHGFGILVEEGRHNTLELILNKLAAKVGLPAVNASAT